MSIESRLPERRGDGAGPGHGHGRGPDARPSARSTRSSPRTPCRPRRMSDDDDHDRHEQRTRPRPCQATRRHVLTYDVRRGRTPRSPPPLLLIGSPMGAAGFVTLACHFPDRTVVTYDPRGVERSAKDDPAAQSTPEQHADDLHGSSPASAAARSTCSPAAAARSTRWRSSPRTRSDVRTLVAHEPPLASLAARPRGRPGRLPRRPRRRTSAAGSAPGMAQLHRAWSIHQGPFTADDCAASPRPIRRCSACRPRTTAPGPTRCSARTSSRAPLRARLRGAAGGADADRPRRRRGVRGRARPSRRATRSPSASGTTPVIFPSDHGGFLGGEYGQTGKPDEFAAKLREVLPG